MCVSCEIEGLGSAVGRAAAATSAFAGVDPEIDGLLGAFDDEGGAGLAGGGAEPAADGAERFAGACGELACLAGGDTLDDLEIFAHDLGALSGGAVHLRLVDGEDVELRHCWSSFLDDELARRTGTTNCAQDTGVKVAPSGECHWMRLTVERANE